MGCAYLLKHTIDTVAQLTQGTHSVSQGRIIVAPAVMDGLITAGETYSTFLKELSTREMEVLSWIAKGLPQQHHYRGAVPGAQDGGAAHQSHLQSIYSKLGGAPASKHPRVYAITLSLWATGLLSGKHVTDS